MLIEVYHVVADQYPVSSTEADIEAGNAVAINSDEEIVLSDADDSTNTTIGIAGDAKGTEGPTTDYSKQVIMGAGSTEKYTQNRVSDFYNETLGSDMITVYSGGGKFYISDDVFSSAATVSPGDHLDPAANGELAIDNSPDVDIAVAVGSASAYPSGVPGTDTDGHMQLETPENDTWIPVVLRI